MLEKWFEPSKEAVDELKKYLGYLEAEEFGDHNEEDLEQILKEEVQAPVLGLKKSLSLNKEKPALKVKTVDFLEEVKKIIVTEPWKDGGLMSLIKHYNTLFAHYSQDFVACMNNLLGINDKSEKIFSIYDVPYIKNSVDPDTKVMAILLQNLLHW